MSGKIVHCLVALLVLVVAARVQCPQAWPLLQRLPVGADYHQYYFGLLALRAGVCIYRDADYFAFCANDGSGHQPLAIFNPPAFYLLMEPFGQSDFLSSFWMFLLTSSLFSLACLLALCLNLFASRPLAWVAAGLAWIALLNSPQGVDNLALGQLGFWLVGCFILTWLFDQWKRPELAGFFLSWAVFLKMWPLLLLAYFARHRRWKVIGWCLGWLTFFSLIQLVRLGWPLHLAYLQHFGTAGLSMGVMSQSIIGVATTWFGAGIMPLATPLNLVIMLLGLALLWRVTPATEQCTPVVARQRLLLEFSAYLILALVCSAWSWPHHRLILIIPILGLCATCERETSEQPDGPWLLALIALASYWTVDGDIVQVPMLFYLHQQCAAMGLGLAAQGFAWLCLAYSLWRTQPKRLRTALPSGRPSRSTAETGTN